MQMPESLCHRKLIEYGIRKMYDEGILNSSFIVYDSTHECMSQNQPPLIIGNNKQSVVPDIYGISKLNGSIVIGEAKTKNDMERKHSLDQYQVFVEHCIRSKAICIIVLIVEFGCYARMKSIVRNRLQPIVDSKIVFKIFEF